MPAIVRGHCFQPLSFREQLSMFSIPFSSLTIDKFPMPVLFCTSFCDFRSRRFRLRSASSFPACFHLPAVCRLDLATPAGVGGPFVLRMDAISTPALHLPPGVLMAIIDACTVQSNYYEPGSQKRSKETLLAKAD